MFGLCAWFLECYLYCQSDIRFEDQVVAAVEKCVQTFGGLDILINNASAIWPRPTLDTNMKKYDLMNTVNARGTYLTSRVCLPYLLESAKRVSMKLYQKQPKAYICCRNLVNNTF